MMNTDFLLYPPKAKGLIKCKVFSKNTLATTWKEEDFLKNPLALTFARIKQSLYLCQNIRMSSLTKKEIFNGFIDTIK